MFIPKELKQAISNLSATEKDKIIFRLLKKDIVFANQLLFELVSTKTVEEQREDIKNYLTLYIQKSHKNFYSSGYLHWDIRDMSGTINEHVKITKDKYGEISLNLYMIIEVLRLNNKHILIEPQVKSIKFCTAVCARVFKIMLLIKKLNQDYFSDFQDDLQKLATLVGNNDYLMRSAMQNGLDVNWLYHANIPDDIDQIHKKLRQNGYL